MLRRSVNITLLLIIGLYYNGTPAFWLAYSTVARNFFIERCENPTKPCCKGTCQVSHIEDKSGTSNQSSSRTIQIADLQPTIFTEFKLSEPMREVKTIPLQNTDHILTGIISTLFRPPRA